MDTSKNTTYNTHVIAGMVSECSRTMPRNLFVFRGF